MKIIFMRLSAAGFATLRHKALSKACFQDTCMALAVMPFIRPRRPERALMRPEGAHTMMEMILMDFSR